ncbi:hypothetical protein [Streptomyces sp. NBC_01483]|uniref:hypothetical protein n=1 Tax=Streptomyces sp. NBC_01483 TaxID=2903883 RepID=UPI002E326386|nr:hypothetical protein [Streptomyces sp. NBC_01483]
MRSPSGFPSSAFTLCSVMTAGQGPLRSPATEAYSTTLPPVSSALTTGPSSQDPCVALTVTQRPSAAVPASRAAGVRPPAEPCRAGPIGDFDSENVHQVEVEHVHVHLPRMLKTAAS